MVKQIGAVDRLSGGDTQVESLSGFSNKDSTQLIPEHFASVSNEYLPVDLQELPSYLPALPAPQVEEYEDEENKIHTTN